MTLNPGQKLAIMELVTLSLEGQAEPEQFDRLVDILRESQEARAFYFEALAIGESVRKMNWDEELLELSRPEESRFGRLWQEMLEREKTAAPLDNPQPEETHPAGNEEEPVRRNAYKGNNLLLIAATVMLGLVSLLLTVDRMASRTTRTRAIVTRSCNARWDNAQEIRTNRPLPLGRLRLAEGLAEIGFENGASVILEAPATVRIVSDSRMYLYRGKLTARVGRQAIGFVIDTPGGKVLDLGTEFALRVENDDRSQVHVFQGEVMVYPDRTGGNRRLSAGKAGTIDRNGDLEEVACRPEEFVRNEEFALQIAAHEGDARSRWKTMVYRLHRDPSLVGHYFEILNETRPEMASNAVPSATLSEAAILGGHDRNAPAWVEGRWPGEPAIRMERGKNQAVVIPANDRLSINGPVTLSAWVCYPAGTKRGGHLISCRFNAEVSYQYSMFDRHYSVASQLNRFEFLRYDKSGQNRIYSRPFVQESGVWYHFTVTHDNQTVCFYVNGELFETSALKVKPAKRAADITIGSVFLDNRYEMTEGDFEGVIDDVMIFNRCLEAVDINEIYEAGKPVSSQQQ